MLVFGRITQGKDRDVGGGCQDGCWGCSGRGFYDWPDDFTIEVSSDIYQIVLYHVVAFVLDAATGNQIDLETEQFLDLFGEVDELYANAVVELDKDVYVAVILLIATGIGAKNVKGVDGIMGKEIVSFGNEL